MKIKTNNNHIKIKQKIKYLLINLCLILLPKKSFHYNRCIMYHSIFKDKIIINDIHSVKYSDFIDQINFLKKFKISPINQIHKTKEEFFITFDDGYKDTILLAYPLLKKLNIPFTIFVTTSNLKDKSGVFLNYRDLKKLAKDKNITIGSHSKNHTSLAGLNNKNLFNELKGSKQELEKIIKKKVTCVSFPNGSFDQNVINTCKKVGYKYLCNSIAEPNSLSEKSNTLLINRQAITYWDKNFGFKNKILGKYDNINSLKNFSKLLLEQYIK